jgi:hypothetical protein
MNNKAFKAQNNEFHEGFAMTFLNGCTISVQFSKHTFCDSGHTTAEVAVWDDKGNWLLFDKDNSLWIEISDGSDVMTYQSPEDVAKLIYTLSQK